MEAVIFIGVQGAGKTTFYKKRVFETHVRISRDMVKTRHREQVLVTACLVAKQPFVVDNTNVLLRQRAPFIASSKTAGFRVVGYYFDCDVREALRRNNARPVGQVIPPAGVIGNFKRLERPSMIEGFDKLWVVRIEANDTFEIQPYSGEE
jgi:predicted kinase